MTFLGLQLSQMSLKFLDLGDDLLLLDGQLLFLARGRGRLGRRVGHGCAFCGAALAELCVLRGGASAGVGARRRARLAAEGYTDASEAAVREAATSRAGLGDDVGDLRELRNVSYQAVSALVER